MGYIEGAGQVEMLATPAGEDTVVGAIEILPGPQAPEEDRSAGADLGGSAVLPNIKQAVPESRQEDQAVPAGGGGEKFISREINQVSEIFEYK